MTISYKEVTYKPETRTVIDKVNCDLCGLENWDDDEWSDCGYETESVVIRHESGDVYPGARYTTSTEFHVCPSCFSDVLIPFMKSKGAAPTIKDTSYG